MLITNIYVWRYNNKPLRFILTKSKLINQQNRSNLRD